MFDCYLRPGEALELRQGDLVRPTNSHRHFAINLHPSERLESSKVGMTDETLMLDSATTPWMGSSVVQPTCQKPCANMVSDVWLGTLTMETLVMS